MDAIFLRQVRAGNEAVLLALERLSPIPVDVAPRFVTAEALAPR